MKKILLRQFTAIVATILLVVPGGGAAFAAAPPNPTISEQETSGKQDKLTNNLEDVSALLDHINADRKVALKPTLVEDAKLDQVAYEYAEILYKAGPEFRKTTDFNTLPNGEKVRYLVSNNDVTGLKSFYYSVFFRVDTIATAKEYEDQAIQGDYSNIGIACCTGADGFKVVVLMFSK